MHVEFDDLRGEVRAGGVSALCTPEGQRGELRLGGKDGPVVRPVTFGERSAAAGDALGSTRRRELLCGALRIHAISQPGADDLLLDELVDCVVLALAGSDEDRAPSFADTALGVLRATGGELSSLLDAPAREVDRLSIALLGELDEPSDEGWTRLVLAPEALSLTGLRDLLADALLARAAAPASRQPPLTDERPAGGPESHEPVPLDPFRRVPRPTDPAPEPGLTAAAQPPQPRAAGRTRAWPAAGVPEPAGLPQHGPQARIVQPSPPGQADVSASLSAPDDSTPVVPRGLVPRPAHPQAAGRHALEPPEAPPAKRRAGDEPTADPRGATLETRRIGDLVSAPPPSPSAGAAAGAHDVTAAGEARAVAGPYAALARRHRDDVVELDLADLLAAALHDEADLRGLDQ